MWVVSIDFFFKTRKSSFYQCVIVLTFVSSDNIPHSISSATVFSGCVFDNKCHGYFSIASASFLQCYYSNVYFWLKFQICMSCQMIIIMVCVPNPTQNPVNLPIFLREEFFGSKITSVNISDCNVRLDAVSQYLDVVFISCYKRNARRTSLLMSTIVVVLLRETVSGGDLKLKTVEEYLHLSTGCRVFLRLVLFLLLHGGFDCRIALLQCRHLPFEYCHALLLCFHGWFEP